MVISQSIFAITRSIDCTSTLPNFASFRGAARRRTRNPGAAYAGFAG
jgi:hypothetical protein